LLNGATIEQTLWPISTASDSQHPHRYALKHQLTRLSELMSPDKKRAAGLDKLTDQEKKALNDFMINLLSEVYAKGQAACGAENTATVPRQRLTSPAYATGGGHWIGSNADGKIITLEDGSIWQIAELDQIDTQLWLPVTDITVISDRSPVGEYKYILINKDDGEKAHAKYLGHE